MWLGLESEASHMLSKHSAPLAVSDVAQFEEQWTVHSSISCRCGRVTAESENGEDAW